MCLCILISVKTDRNVANDGSKNVDAEAINGLPSIESKPDGRYTSYVIKQRRPSYIYRAPSCCYYIYSGESVKKSCRCVASYQHARVMLFDRIIATNLCSKFVSDYLNYINLYQFYRFRIMYNCFLNSDFVYIEFINVQVFMQSGQASRILNRKYMFRASARYMDIYIMFTMCQCFQNNKKFRGEYEERGKNIIDIYKKF